MNRIAMLCPYFGNLVTSQFKLWIKSCATNSSFDFILFSDDQRINDINLPANVHFISMTWPECQNLVHNKMGGNINIGRPYKLCDYRPAFGIIFSDYLTDYDYWGYGDNADTIWGDLRAFIDDDCLMKYDKIGIYGHFALMRNSAENNNRYLTPSKSGMPLEEIFTREETTCFDDMWHSHTINTVFKENGYSIYETPKNFVADILPRFYQFRLWSKRLKNNK